MAAKSEDRLDVFEWCVEVINSCTTIQHLKSARKLVDLYCAKYQSDYFVIEYTVPKLHRLINSKLFEIR